MNLDLEEFYRTESRRCFATLVRLLNDFDLAEEALQEAFAAALVQWPRDGLPQNPRSWLISTGRFKAIDVLRRRTLLDARLQELGRELEEAAPPPEDDEDVPDDRLRLVFTCCHPALAPPVQVALTLREVCGLKTEEIASAFLTSPVTLAQRLVRGKAKIRGAGIPYRVPGLEELPERLDSVLAVVYLVFNEGYSASSGSRITRANLSQEAIRLGRLLLELLPDPEVQGLLALMLLHESRRAARTSPEGDLILLEDQDRSLWDADLIAEGRALAQRAVAGPVVGPYGLQASIAAVHASAQTTDWGRIVALYDLLLRAQPSPVVELNRAVAVAMRSGPAAGLELVERLRERGELADYHLLYAVQADLHRRLGHTGQALAAYRKALERARQEPERRFLEARITSITGPSPRPVAGGDE